MVQKVDKKNQDLDQKKTSEQRAEEMLVALDGITKTGDELESQISTLINRRLSPKSEIGVLKNDISRLRSHIKIMVLRFKSQLTE